MHRQLHAQCRIDLTLEAASFLLVKGQGQKGEFFQAVDPADGEMKNCIPATSLKGVWRSAAERILRSFDASLACDPFSEQSCSKRMESKSVAAAEVYAHLCPACRLFGCTAHAGLLTIHDGWGILMEESRRTGIAIDRFTGGVKKGALYTVNPLHAKATFGVKV
jgi:CRISPR/Cas system CSM-associated protein Csm3 (group 7 of RAMP superfamily)